MNIQYFHKYVRYIGVMCAALGSFIPTHSFILAQETTTEAVAQQADKVNQLEQQISLALQSINENQASVTQLQSEIEVLNERQGEVQAEIVVQNEKVNQRVHAMRERLVAIQLSQRSENSFLTLLSSENFSDLVNRFFIFHQIFTNDQQLIDETNQAIAHLKELEDEIIANQEALVKKHEAVITQTATINQEITQLKQTLSDNQATFAALQERKKNEQETLKQVEAVVEQTNASINSIDSSSGASSKPANESSSSTQTVQSEPTVAESSSTSQPASIEGSDSSSSTADSSSSTATTLTPPTNGRQLTVRATAYSYNEPGLTFFTAMGYDLRQNPMMVAVDPSVIPLGSIVDVPGYGVAIAGDTGGAIKGNKIDLHYVDLQTAKNYGVQTVTITIY